MLLNTQISAACISLDVLLSVLCARNRPPPCPTRPPQRQQYHLFQPPTSPSSKESTSCNTVGRSMPTLNKPQALKLTWTPIHSIGLLTWSPSRALLDCSTTSKDLLSSILAPTLRCSKMVLSPRSVFRCCIPECSVVDQSCSGRIPRTRMAAITLSSYQKRWTR